MKRARKTETVPVTARQFIEAWQKSSSVAEVAAKVRRKKAACRGLAFRYRRMGVAVKVFAVVEIPETDWEELSQYAAALLSEQAGAPLRRTCERDGGVPQALNGDLEAGAPPRRTCER